MKEDTRPLMVTIRCITYNHEPYIRQCLEGFVMQKTNFRFEAIVHDDASTDGTAAIVKEYAEKYPDIIKPIFETENLYSKHDGSLRRIMDEHTHGKYVALCEGDDYWIDPLKLQKQVEILEANPDCTSCSAGFELYDLIAKQSIDATIYKAAPIRYTINDWANSWFLKTLTLMCRSDVYLKCSRKCNKYSWPKDIYIQYHLLIEGDGIYLCEKMAVYHRHEGGVWGGLDPSAQFYQNYLSFKEISEKNASEYYAKRAYLRSMFKMISCPEITQPPKKLLIMECIRSRKSLIDNLKLLKAVVLCFLRKISMKK